MDEKERGWKDQNRPLGTRRWESVYVWLYDAFVQRGRFANDVDLLLGVLYKKGGGIFKDSGSGCKSWNE